MAHDAGRAVRPAHAQPSLRDVFALELKARLPRLVAARDGVSEDLEAARRDAHTLGTSAYVVQEPEIGALARAVEPELAAGPLAELVQRLQEWTP